MLSPKEIEEKYDLEILKLLELEKKEYKKLKRIRLRIEKTEILEKIYTKDTLSEIKELKEIQTKLEELEIKMLRKRHINETSGLKTLMEQQIELKEKNKKTADKIREYKIGIDTIISDVEDLRITAINKLSERERIITKTNELEGDKNHDRVIILDTNN